MDDRIRKVLDHVEGNLSLRLELKDLAEIACMSPGHFHRTFKTETNRTPFRFIEEIRMNKAFQMVLSGSKTIHELTSQLGYNDYETFSRSFKKHHAIAPDDLKAIALKIKTEFGVNEEDLIIKTFEVDEVSEIKAVMDQLADTLKQLLIEKGLSEEDIRGSRIMSVMPKLEDVKKGKGVVKNKYVIKEDPKIWQELLNHSQNGND